MSRRVLIGFVALLLAPALLPAAVSAQEGGEGTEVERLDWRLAEIWQSGRVIDEVEVQVHGFPDALAAASNAFTEAGGTIDVVVGEVIYGHVPASALPTLEGDARIRWVEPPTLVHPEEVAGEGVAFMGADAWHTAGFDGTGIRVGIMDSGFSGLAAAQANGDLPSLPAAQLNATGCADMDGSTGHGTAVAEIVHEVAPGATLFLACTTNTGDWATAFNWFSTNDVLIMSVSLGTFNTGRGDGTGSLATFATAARSNGILWVNSAGNYGETHWSGSHGGVADGQYVDFWLGSGYDDTQTFTLGGGGTARVYAKWDDWPSTDCDFDVELWSSDETTMHADSTNTQNGTQPPTETLSVTNTGGTSVELNVKLKKTNCPSSPRIDLFILGGGSIDRFKSPSSITGLVPHALITAVGAVCVNNSTGTGIEAYSSRGPTIDGLLKPDVSAPDNVSSLTYGAGSGCPAGTGVKAGTYPEGFTGTSAAAPHAAGAAALLAQALGLTTQDTANAEALRTQLLAHTSDDADGDGPDNAYGVGMVDLGVPPDPLLNDDFGDALLVAGLPLNASQSTFGATEEPDEPLSCSSILGTVWYRFTPGSTYDLTADTNGSDFDTILAVYTGSSLATLSLVGCNDDFNGLLSEVTFTGAAGTTYWFQIGGYNGVDGDLQFNLDGVLTVPAVVTGVSASDGSYADKVWVTWGAVSEADSYEVYRATEELGSKTTIGSPASPNYDDMSAVPGTTYYYWVRACNAGGCSSSYSDHDTGWRDADTTDPVVTPPDDVTVYATSAAGAVVTYPPATATDNVGVTTGPTCLPASGSLFPLGDTIVTCTAGDAAGNTGTATFTVKVEAPVCGKASATIIGGPGADVLVGTSGPDVIVGLGGDDTITGLAGDDIICGGPGDDIIDGGADDDSIWGDHGHDEITGGPGNDQLNGGRGADRVIYSDAPGGVTVDLTAGVASGHGNDTIKRSEHITGSDWDDTITGHGGKNKIEGLDGNDTIDGVGKRDALRGGDGDDAIYGGTGNDSLAGNAGDDSLSGQDGNDILNGGSGTDALDGGPGDDTLNGGSGKEDRCWDGETYVGCEKDQYGALSRPMHDDAGRWIWFGTAAFLPS